jgi:hypothetical protein
MLQILQMTSDGSRLFAGMSQSGQVVMLDTVHRSRLNQVVEVPDDVPVPIGLLPLYQLDFVIDLRNRTLSPQTPFAVGLRAFGATTTVT